MKTDFKITWILSKCVPQTHFWMQLHFFAIFMLPIAILLALGSKTKLAKVPREVVVDAKMRPKCLTGKSPPPDRAIERTNGLQDCQNGARLCQKSPQNVSESYSKRQQYRFKNHDCLQHYCFDFADSLYSFISHSNAFNFTHSIHSFNARPNFKQNVFCCCTCKLANTFLQVGAFL